MARRAGSDPGQSRSISRPLPICPPPGPPPPPLLSSSPPFPSLGFHPCVSARVLRVCTALRRFQTDQLSARAAHQATGWSAAQTRRTKEGGHQAGLGLKALREEVSPGGSQTPHPTVLLYFVFFLLHVALQDNDFCSHSLRVVERLLVESHSVPSTVVLFLSLFFLIESLIFFLPLFHNS